MIAHLLGQLYLAPGDKVAAVTWFRDFAIVVTEQGHVHKLVLAGYEV